MTSPLRLLLLAVLLSGCTMVRYNSPSLADHQRSTTQTVRSLSYLWGVIPPNKISLESCGTGKMKSMKVQMGLVDSIITYATAGVVISYKVKFTCV